MKKSKQANHDKYFEINWNNIKNTWKRIQSLVSLKLQHPVYQLYCPLIMVILSITNPYDIANTFNNYFASIAETTKKSIKYSHKQFSDYLPNDFCNLLIKKK